MRLFHDGEALEIPGDVVIETVDDRVMVRTPDGSFSALAVRDGDSILVSYRGHQYKLDTKLARAAAGGGVGKGEYRAPMPGLIVDVLVALGDPVTAGQKILVLEAMKTQQPFIAPFDGKVTVLNAVKGAQVTGDDLLAVVTPNE
ncbi:MAG TPA: acetyl-CoA carboxylase biotin carboxyl carrier protein subunit [Fimbriimonas sp.]|nr:acetyl-CoA carboxylase biotin carboxyl carrier protein subunit [Fimbriimonas sp.]